MEGGRNNEDKELMYRGGKVIVRMSGIKYEWNEKKVMEFFEEGEN